MLKAGIYVDAENLKRSGGYGMRYDVLRDFVGSHGQYTVLRSNSYLAVDKEQPEGSPYMVKLSKYLKILRRCGFKIVEKPVKRYTAEDGSVATKANADMDLAIDCILQAKNLDRVVLLTGDGDFVRLVVALQNMGCRVDIISFDNVSRDLRESADSYISGYLVPGLLPFPASKKGDWYRGCVTNYDSDKGFGFMEYFVKKGNEFVREEIFFHASNTPTNGRDIHIGRTIYNFMISDGNGDKIQAVSLDIATNG